MVGFQENQAGEAPCLRWMKVEQRDKGRGRKEQDGWDQPAQDRVPAAPHTGNRDSGDRVGEPRKGIPTPQVLAAHLFALTLRTTPHSRPVGEVFSRPEQGFGRRRAGGGRKGGSCRSVRGDTHHPCGQGPCGRSPWASGPHPGVTWTGVISEPGRVPRDPRNIWGEFWGQGPLEVG